MDTGLGALESCRGVLKQTTSPLACESYALKKKNKATMSNPVSFKMHAVQSQILNKCKTQLSKLGTETIRP